MPVRKKIAARGQRIGIVVSRFNEFITRRLLDGCLAEFQRRGIKDSTLTVVWVPGAFEIPLTALKLAKRRDVAAVVCLGAVIRGETLHYDLVAQAAAQGIREAALATGKPVVFGVLTTETVDQAYKRSDEQGDHKGREAAEVALEMMATLKRIS